MYTNGEFLKKGIELDNNKDDYTSKNVFVDFLNWVNDNDLEFKLLEIKEVSSYDKTIFSISKYKNVRINDFIEYNESENDLDVPFCELLLEGVTNNNVNESDDILEFISIKIEWDALQDYKCYFGIKKNESYKMELVLNKEDSVENFILEW